MEKARQFLVATSDLEYKNSSLEGRCSEEILESIRNRGIVNPLLIAQVNGCYRVYIGNQRLAAARRLGICFVPCVIVASSDDVHHAYSSYYEV